MSLALDTLVLFRRSILKLVRVPILLFFSLVQPLIFLLLFTQLFDRFALLPGFPAKNYLLFSLPGIVLMNAFSSSFQSGISIVDDLRSGFLERMLTTPVSRMAILLGRMLTDALRMVLQSLIILTVGYVMGASVETGVPGILMVLATVALFGLAWAGIAQIVALRTKNSEAVFGFGAFLTFPLLFMSTALTPEFFMPQWMQTVSKFNPISYTVEALRVLVLSGFDWGVIGQAYGVIIGIAVVTVGGSIFMFRRVIE